MADSFDPYHKWLGIPPQDQPANHYRLLGVERLEDDADVISSAADQRMNFLRQFQNGERTVLAQQLLNEIASARVCLLDVKKKEDYDRNLKQEMGFALSDTARSDNEALAATTEFVANEDAPEWPTKPVVGSLVDSEWAAESESSTNINNQEPDVASRKTKMRFTILSLLSALAILLLFGVMLSSANRNNREGQNNKIDEIGAVASRSQPYANDQGAEIEPAGATNEPGDRQKAKVDEQQIVREAKEKAEREAEQKAKQEAERKVRAEADRKAKEEADRKAKEDAERRALEEQEAAAERRRLAGELRKKVDQSVNEAMQQRERPQKSIAILQKIFLEVSSAELPRPVKKHLEQRIRSAVNQIHHDADRQREKKEKEAERQWRKDHPDKYLDSLGLVMEKNSWQIRAALELGELSKPLTKFLLEYQRKKKGLEKKASKIQFLENKLLTDMQKLRGAFQSAEFREWVLDGMQDYPGARGSKRQKVDRGRQEFDRFREQLPSLANRLEKKVSELKSNKDELRDDLESLMDARSSLEHLDERAYELIESVEATEKRLDRERKYFEPALQSTGLSLEEPNFKNVENLLKRADEILNDRSLNQYRDK